MRLSKQKGQVNRFKFLTTYCQVLNYPITRSLVQKGDLDNAMSYIERFVPKVPVPLHYEFLTKLGLLVQETSEKISVVSKKTKGVVLEIKNDPLCSGSESLKLALVVLASEYDNSPYNVDFTMENRKVLFNEYVKKYNLDISYDEYLSGLNEKEVGDLKLVEVRDDDMEITVENIKEDCKTGELLTSEEVYQILEQVKDRCVVFQCRMKPSDKLEYPGFRVDNINNVTRRFVPKKEMLFAPGPEHEHHISNLVSFLRQFGKPEGKMFEYKPCVVKNMMRANKKEAGALVVDFTKKNVAEDSQEEILSLISEDKRLLKKYVELRELFETHRDMIQAQPHLRDSLTDFEGPPAWRKKVTDIRQSCSGKTFNQVVMGGTRALKEFISGVAYKQALASGRRAPMDMTMKECFDAFLDNMIRSPAHFPEMARVGTLYRFTGSHLDNNRYAGKVNPTKDPLQLNIDAGILDELGQFPEPNVEMLMKRLSGMNSVTPMEDGSTTTYGLEEETLNLEQQDSSFEEEDNPENL